MAVEPLEASTTVVPSCSQPLHSACRNRLRASRCLRLPVGWLDSSFRYRSTPGEAGQRQRDQVRVAAALEVGLDAADGLAHPGAAVLEAAAGRAHSTILRSQSGIGTALPCGMFSHTVVAPPVA